MRLALDRGFPFSKVLVRLFQPGPQAGVLNCEPPVAMTCSDVMSSGVKAALRVLYAHCSDG
jgi:hypothetical protein